MFIIHDDCDDTNPEHFELELQIELIETTRTFKNKEKNFLFVRLERTASTLNSWRTCDGFLKYFICFEL